MFISLGLGEFQRWDSCTRSKLLFRWMWLFRFYFEEIQRLSTSFSWKNMKRLNLKCNFLKKIYGKLSNFLTFHWKPSLLPEFHLWRFLLLCSCTSHEDQVSAPDPLCSTTNESIKFIQNHKSLAFYLTFLKKTPENAENFINRQRHQSSNSSKLTLNSAKDFKLRREHRHVWIFFEKQIESSLDVADYNKQNNKSDCFENTFHLATKHNSADCYKKRSRLSYVWKPSECYR